MMQQAFNRVLRVALVLSFFVTLLNLMVPLTMMLLLLWVIPSDTTAGIPLILGLALGGLFFMALMDGVRFWGVQRFAHYLNATLGKPILLKLFRDRADVQQSNAREAMNDLRRIRSFLTSPGATAVLDTMMMPVMLIVIFMINATMAIVALLCVALILVLKWARRRSTQAHLERSQQDMARANALAEEGVEQAQTIEAMGMRANLEQRWLKIQRQVIRNQSANNETAGSDAAAFKALGWIMQILMMGVGYGMMFSQEGGGAGTIIAVIMAARMIVPLQGVLNSWQQVIESMQAFGRLKAFAQEQADQKQEGRLDLPAPQGLIQAQGVSYRRGAAMLLKGVSFTLKPGQVMGLIGPSGAGKSTLARILTGAAYPSSGLVRLDGADMHQWDPDHLGPHLGYLPQEIELFAGTIGENIARFQIDADPQAIEDAARRAGLHESVEQLPDGYDSLLEEGGANLPGGLRQRVGLARALYGDPSILILDEPDAFLDQPGMEALGAVLQESPKRGMTVILVTHKPQLLRFTQVLLVLRDGSVSQLGPTKKVIAAMQQPAQNQPVPLRPPTAAEAAV